MRCRVNQVGGMGILERLHRPCKYACVFRHEVEVRADRKRLGPQWQQWSNQARLPSPLGYEVPWQKLVAEATATSEQVEEMLGALPNVPTWTSSMRRLR